MKRFASETDLQGCEVSWRLEGDDLARFSGSDGGHEDLLLDENRAGRRRLNEDEEGQASFLERGDGDATFPFETAPAGLIGSNGQSGTVGGGSTGTAVRGLSPYSYGADGFGFEGGVKRGGGKGGGSALEPDFSSDRRSKGIDARSSRSAVERDMLSHRDMFSQSSLERLEEENGSLRAITRYLIHERKELRRKADTAVKRNQNLNNLLQVMRWTLTCGGAAACGVGSSSQLPGNGASGPSSVGQSPTFGSSLPGGDLLVGE